MFFCCYKNAVKSAFYTVVKKGNFPDYKQKISVFLQKVAVLATKIKFCYFLCHFYVKKRPRQKPYK